MNTEIRSESMELATGGIVEIQPNGDPYGTGYVGSESPDGGESWFYRGDVGSRPREWWRRYCRETGRRLRVAR